MAKEAECLELAESYASVRDKKEAEEERKKFLSWFYKKHGNSTSNRYVMEYRRGKESILSESTEDCYEHFPEEEGSFPEALIEEEGEDETEEEEEEEEEDDDDEEEEEEQEDDKGDTAMNEVEYARLNELDILNCDGWLKLSTDNYPWKESPSVYPTTLKFEEIKLTAEEKDGLLTVPIVSTGLSNLSLVPGTVFYALTKLELPKKNLLDISILSNYQFLQYIDISFNRLSDLSPLSQVIYLMVLDASNNQLTSISGFKPPWFLTYLNISWNLLAEIPDLTEFWSLRHVDLSHNRIKTISGLINLKFLSYLNLSYNEIKVLENLSKLPVQELDVSYNVISSWEMGEGRGLRTMHKLKELNLSFNRLTSLLVIKKAFRLLKLNVSFNQISCMHELGYLSTLTRTNCLFLEGNDVSALEESRRLIIYLMPSLAVLNGSPVLPAERVCAVNMYSSDVIVGTMRRMLIHSATFGALSPPLHGVNAMSRMYNPAIVVVIGLPGSYKTVVVSNVAKKYPKFIKLGRVHTTRVIKASEQFQPKDLYKYIELDEFNKMKENGRFAAIEHRLGFKFGVSFDDILFDGRVCLLQMEFGGGLELQWTGYDPTLILALPGDISTHISRVLTIYECDANIIKSEEESFRTLSENEHTLYAQPSFSTDTLSSTKISKDEMINKFNNELMSMNNYFSDPKLRYQDELKFNMRFQPEKYEQDILKSLSEQSNKSTEGSTVCPPEKNPSGSSDSSLLPGNEEETHDFHWKYKTSAQLYVASVMELRDQYIEAHINNPGLFTLAVATDDLEVASHKVASVCHEVFNNIGKKMNDSQNRMMDMLKQDECYNDVVGVRLANMMHELRAKQSTAQEQQYESELIRTSKDN